MVSSQEKMVVLTDERSDPATFVAEIKRSTRFDAFAVGLGGIALVVLVAFIIKDYSPFIVAAALFLLLFPFREYRAARTIMFTGGILLGFWLFVTLASLLFPFILGLLIAYLFNPVVGWIEEKWKISRGWSSLVIVVLLIGIVTGLALILIPMLVEQLQALLGVISQYMQSSSLTFDEKGIREFCLRVGLPQSFVDQYVTHEILPKVKEITGQMPNIIITILESIPTYATRVLDLVIIPVAAIYFLKDWNVMIDSIQSLIPQRHRPSFISTFQRIDKVLYGYMRGQSTVAVIIGTLGAITFSIIGIPYAILIGLAIALLDLIPFIGLIFSILIVEAVVMITMPMNLWNLLSPIIVVGALHTFENYYLGPRIVGKGINIPPVLIIMSLFVFSFFMGFLGMLIAVPLTGIIMLFVREYRQALVEHPLM
ncbi:MAG: AI-2E family transporter [bacterium]